MRETRETSLLPAGGGGGGGRKPGVLALTGGQQRQLLARAYFVLFMMLGVIAGPASGQPCSLGQYLGTAPGVATSTCQPCADLI